ncbi:hypothetical protein ACTXT7_005471, partial [Hymenolepis weldensis]
MSGPPPPPPPPPPGPPLPSIGGGGGGGQPAFLADIRKGAQLKKVPDSLKNDRSAALVFTYAKIGKEIKKALLYLNSVFFGLHAYVVAVEFLTKTIEEWEKPLQYKANLLKLAVLRTQNRNADGDDYTMLILGLQKKRLPSLKFELVRSYNCNALRTTPKNPERAYRYSATSYILDANDLLRSEGRPDQDLSIPLEYTCLNIKPVTYLASSIYAGLDVEVGRQGPGVGGGGGGSVGAVSGGGRPMGPPMGGAGGAVPSNADIRAKLNAMFGGAPMPAAAPRADLQSPVKRPSFSSQSQSPKFVPAQPPPPPPPRPPSQAELNSSSVIPVLTAQQQPQPQAPRPRREAPRAPTPNCVNGAPRSFRPKPQ